MSETRLIALLGGTFDPVHLGHLRAAWEVSELLDAEVRLMPAAQPPHRPPPQASVAQRVALLRAALAGQTRLRLDTRELSREGPSYSVDSLRSLREEAGAEAPLMLLLGADAFLGLASWDRWWELFELAHIGVLTRPGIRTPEIVDSESLSPGIVNPAGVHGLPAKLDLACTGRWESQAARLREKPAGHVMLIAVTALDISASQVRAALGEGRVPRFLLPDALVADAALLAPYRGGN